MDATFEPGELHSMAIRKVVQNIELFINVVGELPSEMRGTIAYLMSKRGLINDGNIEKVCKCII